MEAYLRGGLICKNDFLGGGLFEGGWLIRAWGLIQGFMVCKHQDNSVFLKNKKVNGTYIFYKKLISD